MWNILSCPTTVADGSRVSGMQLRHFQCRFQWNSIIMTLMLQVGCNQPTDYGWVLFPVVMWKRGLHYYLLECLPSGFHSIHLENRFRNSRNLVHKKS